MKEGLIREIEDLKKIMSFLPDSTYGNQMLTILENLLRKWEMNRENYEKVGKALGTNEFRIVNTFLLIAATDSLQNFMATRATEIMISYIEKDPIVPENKEVKQENVLRLMAKDAIAFQMNFYKEKLGIDFKFDEEDVELVKESLRPAFQPLFDKI
jgi:hypothetical protein